MLPLPTSTNEQEKNLTPSPTRKRALLWLAKTLTRAWVNHYTAYCFPYPLWHGRRRGVDKKEPNIFWNKSLTELNTIANEFKNDFWTRFDGEVNWWSLKKVLIMMLSLITTMKVLKMTNHPLYNFLPSAAEILTLNGPSCFLENLKFERKKLFNQRILQIQKRQSADFVVKALGFR